jgi:phage tail sheath gpL-like
MGREAAISWNAGETDIQGATKLVAAVNALGDDLPFTAANGGGTLATVTLTFRFAGAIGNDVTLFLTDKDGTGGTVTLTGATLASGTLEPTLTTVLTLISSREYDFMLPVVSNADAAAASTTSGPGRVKTHINTYGSGFGAHLQQAVVGVTGSISAVKTGAAQHNFGPMQYVFCQAGQSLGCEFSGAEVGARMREETLDPNVNRINVPYRALLFGARDHVADDLTAPEHEDLLQSGVTPVTYTIGNEPRPSRPITTYFKDTAGNPDARILDVGQVSGIYAVAKDLRVALPQQFPNTKLSEDLAVGDDDLPEGVTQVHEVRAFTITRLRFFQKRGVVRGDELDKAINPPPVGLGTLIVRVNPSDNHQCDLVVPLAIVPILAKFSLVVQKVA